MAVNCEVDALLKSWSAVQKFALARLSPNVPVVMIGPPVKVESVETWVTVPEPVPAQIPFIEKHPVVRFTPFAKVEVAVVDFIFKIPATESPPANVEVPCPAPTVIAAAKVEVAVVEVAKMLLKNPCAADIFVVEALPNVCKAVHVLARVKSICKALLVLIRPAPVSEVK